MTRAGHPAATKATADYVGWRGELLAQLALARLPGATAYRAAAADDGYDYLVAAADGFCFFVRVKAFSSVRNHLPDVAGLPELTWPVERETVDRARQSRSPVVLFLFDADTEHGRFVRLDTLPQPANGNRAVTLRLPIENAIHKDSLARLLNDLRAGRG